MAKCALCGCTILFGGVKEGPYRFCNRTCHERGAAVVLAPQIPEEIVSDVVQQVHAGACPLCGGAGPVDAHQSFLVYSLIVVSSWKTALALSCRRCARKRQALHMLNCVVCGWWSFPWGIVMTPVQLGRNLACFFGGPDPQVPSSKLEEIVRLDLARQFAHSPPTAPE
jgi:hypothetical protein